MVMDMVTTMTLNDFEERAMAYGARIDGWPEEDQAPARALMAESAAARTALEEAASLDAMLDLWEGPQPSNALLSRVLSDAATVTSEMPVAASAPASAREGWFARLFGTMPVFRPGMALAACLALGFIMGTTIEESVIAPAPTEMAEEISVIDFAFAMEDDSDLLLGPEAFL